MLRIRYGDGLGVARAAAQYGVTVWMTPWGTGANGSPGGPDTTTQTIVKTPAYTARNKIR